MTYADAPAGRRTDHGRQYDMRWTTIRTLELLARADRTTTELALEQLRNRRWIEWAVAELAAESLVVTDPPVASAPGADERTVALADGDVVDRYRRVAERFDLRRVLSPYRERLVRVLATGSTRPGLLPAFNRPSMRRSALATLSEHGVVERSGDRVRLVDDDVRAFLDATAFRWGGPVGPEATATPVAEDTTLLSARDVHAQLRRIDAELDEPATAYLMGGGALALDGLRGGTHDLDLVVDNETTARRVARATPGGEATRMAVDHSHHALFRPEYDGDLYQPFHVETGAGGVQVFWGRIVNTVAVTDSLRARGRPYDAVGAGPADGECRFDCLDVRLFSPVDLLVTMFAKRAEESYYDIERLLARRPGAVDWDAFLAALSTQTARTGVVLAPLVRRRCRRLERHGGVTVPIRDDLDRLTAAQVLPIRLAVPCSRATLATDLPFDDDVLTDAVDGLLASGEIERTDDGRLVATTR